MYKTNSKLTYLQNISCIIKDNNKQEASLSQGMAKCKC